MKPLCIALICIGSTAGCGAKPSSAPTEMVGLPDIEPTLGQIVIEINDFSRLSEISGYVVGKREIYKGTVIAGKFVFPRLPVGIHDVIITASAGPLSLAAAGEQQRVGVRLNRLEANIGQRTEPPAITLMPLRRVTGRVRLTAQSNSEGVSVSIPGTDYATTSDSSGNFEFTGVPFGQHDFIFEKSGHRMGRAQAVDLASDSLEIQLPAFELVPDTGDEETLTLNSGVQVSSSRTTQGVIAGSDEAVLMKISENENFEGASWKPLRTTFTYTFETDGAKTLYVKVADANGLESSPLKASVLVASQEPTAELRLVTPDCRAPTFSLNISARIGSAPTQMQVSTSGSLSSSAWEAFSSEKILSKSALTGPIIVKLRDAAERESQSSLTTFSCENSLSQARFDAAGITLGSKAIFAGGVYTQLTNGAGETIISSSNVVDIYESLGHTWSTAELTEARSMLAATTLDSKAFFAGGTIGSGYSSVVDIYDGLTGSWTSANLSLPRYRLAAAAVGTKVLFAGGYNGAYSDVVDIFDVASNTWSTAALSQARGYLVAATAGGKAFFAGGYSIAGASNVVDIYDSATNTWSAAVLSQARGELAAASVGTKALFAGGLAGPSGSVVTSAVVDIYDSSSNTWSVSSLSEARYGLKGISVGEKALFVGGGGSGSNVIDIFSSGSNAWMSLTLPVNTGFLWTAAAVGNRAIFHAGDFLEILDTETNTWSRTTTFDLYQNP